MQQLESKQAPQTRPHEFKNLDRYRDRNIRKEYQKYLKEYRRDQNENLERLHKLLCYKYPSAFEDLETDLESK